MTSNPKMKFLVSLIVFEIAQLINSSRPLMGNDKIFGNHDDDNHYSGGFKKQREPFDYGNCFRTERYLLRFIMNVRTHKL